VFYRKLGEMLKETYEKYRQERLAQLELLAEVEEILARAQNRDRGDDAPAELGGRTVARTYFEVVGETFGEAGIKVPAEQIAKLALAIDDVIERLKIVHWEQNTDVQNQMRIEIEDELFRFKDEHGLDLSFDAMDRIMDTCIEVARRRSGRS
jgi:type I restriction enzyme R subunit